MNSNVFYELNNEQSESIQPAAYHINGGLDIQLNPKTTISAVLWYQTLFSALFEPMAIAFDIDSSTVVIDQFKVRLYYGRLDRWLEENAIKRKTAVRAETV
jgi:hypothetical protein